MRGKALSPIWAALSVRITPAHAGKSHEYNLMHDIQEDHPRTCGEKLFGDLVFGNGVGSPPHMRGKATPIFAAHPPPGITPAHAGKSKMSTQKSRSFKDHPRTCGEKDRVAVV